MTRAKLLIVLTASVLAIGLVSGGVWLFVQRRSGAITAPISTPSTNATAGADTVTTPRQAAPLPAPEPMSIEEMKQITVYPPGGSGGPGSGEPATTLYDLRYPSSTVQALQPLPTGVVIPENRTGTGGAAAGGQVLTGSADPDGDGLTNDQELQLGTDTNSADTDGDGLLDAEEVKTYRTDPLKADTDGDGYSDGVEVKGGYNPLGPGKLK